MVNILKQVPAIAILLAGALAYPAAAATMPTFTLIPINGIISGNPGQVIGWGFTITNSMNYLVVTSSEFDLIPNTQTSIGTYIDFIGPSSLVVGPAPDNTTETQTFNNMMMKGVGSFTIFGNAAPGAMNIGQILLTYDLYSVSPHDPNNFNPDTDLISSGNTLTATAQVNVTNTPEPGSIGLAGSALLLLGALGLRRRAGLACANAHMIVGVAPKRNPGLDHVAQIGFDRS